MPRWLEWVYERSPASVESAVQACLPLARPLLDHRVPVAMLRGPTMAGGWGSVLLAGDGPAMEELPRRFFGGEPQRDELGAWPLWSLPTTLNRLGADADLVFARLDFISAGWLFRRGYLHVPEWLSSRIDVSSESEELAQDSHSLKDDLRVIRREGLSAELTFDPGDCGEFYHTMYLPYAHRRHGSVEILRPLRQLRRAVRHGGILWVRRGRERISGAVFERHRNVLRFLALGTLDGNTELLRAGALAALYLFLIRHAREQRVDTIDLRGTRPYLTDGVLRYKCKWGAKIVPHRITDFDYLVRWSRANESIRRFLRHTPLIFRNHGRLAAITAGNVEPFQASSEEDLRCQRLWLPGVDELFALGEQENEVWTRSRAIPGHDWERRFLSLDRRCVGS